jgi:hypothetical protein
VKVKSEKVEGFTVFRGRWDGSGCIAEDLQHLGEYEWTGGAAKSKFTAVSGTTTFTTTGGSRIKCVASKSVGEYTGLKTLTDSITFTGCLNPTTKHACQSTGAGTGEIVAASLEGHIGFIRDTWTKIEKVVTSVGLDLSRKPALLTAECGTTPVSVGGSVIGVVGVIDKPTTKFPIKYTETAGRQIPEAFELGPNDTLATTFGAGSAEQTGLTSSGSTTNEERLEIRSQYEE